jgi:hypothetical protein
MLNCIAAIMEGDEPLVAEALTEMAKGNRSQGMHSSMEKLVCIHAHALYHMCVSEFATRGIAVPPLPEYPTWDGPFHQHGTSRPHGSACGYFDFAAANPMLAKWLETLPSQAVVDDVLGFVN